MNFLNVLRGPSSYIPKESLSGARQFILGVEEYWDHSPLDEFVIKGIKTTIPFYLTMTPSPNPWLLRSGVRLRSCAPAYTIHAVVEDSDD
jgi:hypothetical protein